MDKKLFKSTQDRKICGVCAGIANYLNIDPTVIRLIWAIAIFFGGTGVLAYIICALIIPDEPVNYQNTDPYYQPTEKE